jgi:hypothetical protein
MHDWAVNVAWVVIIFQIFVISEYSSGEWGAEKVTVVSEASEYSQEFVIMDIIGPFCFIESL